jgi:hypothetical protein
MIDMPIGEESQTKPVQIIADDRNGHYCYASMLCTPTKCSYSTLNFGKRA